MGKTITLLVSKPLSVNTGRNEKLQSRIDMLKSHGWDVSVVCVTVRSLLSCLLIKTNVLVSMSNPLWLHGVAFVVSLFHRRMIWVAEFRDRIDYTHRMSMFVSLFLRSADRVVKIRGGGCQVDGFELPYLGYKKGLYDMIKKIHHDNYWVVFGGHIYKDKVDPTVFFHWLSDDNIFPFNTRIMFFCDGWNQEYEQLTVDLGIYDMIEVHHFVEYDILLGMLLSADALLYIDNVGNDGVVFSKFWDYLATGNDVVVVSPNGGWFMDLFEENERQPITRERHDTVFVELIEEQLCKKNN